MTKQDLLKVIKKQAEAIQKITNLKSSYTKFFGDLKLTIFPQVYSAGSDSSLLYEKVEVYRGEKCLDLCTGSGLIALRMKKLGAESVTAVDINPKAIENTIYNSKNLDINVEVKEGDLFDPIAGQSFDVITINPPFTNKKPSNKVEMMFWDNNYKLIKSFFSQLSGHLNIGGRAFLVWSSFGDEKLLYRLAKTNKFYIKKIGQRYGKGSFIYYVYLINKINDPANILLNFRGKKLKIYDYNLKYGDWLFKLPLIDSMKKMKIDCYLDSVHKIPFINKFKSTEAKQDIALLFTRDNKRTAEKTVLDYQNAIEIRRMSRFTEDILIWENGKMVLRKSFECTYEQQRIEQIGRFLGLTIEETKQTVINPKNKNISIYLGASENIDQRLNLDISQINEFILKSNSLGYKLQIIDDGNNSQAINGLSQTAKEIVIILKTANIKDAFEIIDRNSYYFGSDSGLAHHAVRSGKISFILYNSDYHTEKPLFNSSFWNHLIFFGDRFYINEVIYYLENTRGCKRLLWLYEAIREAISHGSFLLEDQFSNKYKFFRMLLNLVFQDKKSQEEINSLQKKGIPSTIFEPDYLRHVWYENLKETNDAIFVDTNKVIKDIFDLLSKELSNEEFKKTEVWCKNCSFAYGVSFAHTGSDVDFLTVVSDIGPRKKQNIYYGLLRVLNKHSLATSLPHQLPRITKEKQFDVNQPLILNKKIVFKENIPTDNKNLEKWKARIKIKIILNLLSEKEIEKLKARSLKSSNLGKLFVNEIDFLLQDQEKFSLYSTFIKQFDNLISSTDAFGKTIKFSVSYQKKSEPKIIKSIEGLMNHGIVYLSEGLLYINWDLRRPQHGWFIPIVIDFPSKKVENTIVKHTLKSPIFSDATFKLLKSTRNLSSNSKISKLLESNSFILTNEVFRILSVNKQSITLTPKEVRNFSKTKNSNAEDGADKRISLLAAAEICQLNIPEDELTNLSKYNLFAYSLSNLENLDVKNTRFYKNNFFEIENVNWIESDFYSHFIGLLREYYIYDILDLKLLKHQKEKEILFNYFVRGKSLMEGPSKQSDSIKIFLENIPIASIFYDKFHLRKTLQKYSKIYFKTPAADFFPQHIIRRLYEHQQSKIKSSNKHLSSLIALSESAMDILNDKNWNKWKRTSEYKKLLANKNFRGTLWVTFDKKYPIYFFEDSNDGVYIFASNNCLNKFIIHSRPISSKYSICTPLEFTLANKSIFKASPDFSLHSYKELRKNDNVSFDSIAFNVEEIIGEGNYSVVYKISDKKSQVFALKHSVISLNGEYNTSLSLNNISNLFVKCYGLDNFQNHMLLELIKGISFASSRTILTNDQIRKIFHAIIIAFKNKIDFGDITPNNVLISKNNSVHLIDPHFFSSSNINLLKDVLGILYIIYFNKFRKRFESYWPIRNDIINGRIKDIDQLINVIEFSNIELKSVKEFRDIILTNNNKRILKRN